MFEKSGGGGNLLKKKTLNIIIFLVILYSTLLRVVIKSCIPVFSVVLDKVNESKCLRSDILQSEAV